MKNNNNKTSKYKKKQNQKKDNSNNSNSSNSNSNFRRFYKNSRILHSIRLDRNRFPRNFQKKICYKNKITGMIQKILFQKLIIVTFLSSQKIPNQINSKKPKMLKIKQPNN